MLSSLLEETVPFAELLNSLKYGMGVSSVFQEQLITTFTAKKKKKRKEEEGGKKRGKGKEKGEKEERERKEKKKKETDETIGFDTAINTALYAIDKIRDTADAHGRFFLIEVMGRLSGYIALHAGIAGGAEEVFIPEHTIDIDHLCKELCEYREQGKLSSIIIVAEGCQQGNSHIIAKKLEEKCGYPYRVVVLGHLLRGGPPTAKDRILGSRFGDYAISLLTENKGSFMVGCINKNNVCTPS